MNIGKVAKQSVILFSLIGVLVNFFPGKTTRIVLELIGFTVIGLIFYSSYAMFKKLNYDRKKYVMYFFYYSVLVFIHGMFVAKSYEQWRYLVTVYLPILLLPWVTSICTDRVGLYQYVNTFLKVSIPLSFIFFLTGRLGRGEDLFYINFTSFIYLLILALPYFSMRWKLVIIFVSLFSFVLNSSHRTNQLSIIVSYALLGLTILVKHTDKNIFIAVLKTSRIFFLFIPIVLAFLGYISAFNVFEYIEQNEASKISVTSDEINIATDSRTGIYQDAINAIHTPFDLIFGNSPTAYYETILANDYVVYGEYDKGRLGGSEAAILNFLQWGGLIYILVAFLVFSYTSFFAIAKSSNVFVKLVGLAVTMRWLFLFIEHPIGANFTWVSLFMCFGICLSPQFRAMSDQEIKEFFSKF